MSQVSWTCESGCATLVSRPTVAPPGSIQPITADSGFTEEPATVPSAAVGGLREEGLDHELSSRASQSREFAPARPRRHRRERAANTDSSGWGEAPLVLRPGTKGSRSSARLGPDGPSARLSCG